MKRVSLADEVLSSPSSAASTLSAFVISICLSLPCSLPSNLVPTLSPSTGSLGPVPLRPHRSPHRPARLLHLALPSHRCLRSQRVLPPPGRLRREGRAGDAAGPRTWEHVGGAAGGERDEAAALQACVSGCLDFSLVLRVQGLTRSASASRMLETRSSTPIRFVLPSSYLNPLPR